MNEPKYRKAVTQAREFEFTYNTTGMKEVLLPRLKALLEQSDKKCHDVRLREDLGKYNIGVHQGIKNVLEEMEQILRDGRNALKWLRDNDVNID